ARKHDRFYRAAKKQSYRSRAAIKLSQIDLRYGLFEVGDVVVDLGAAPGGWSQLARERIGPKGRVIAVDLSPVSPIEGVEILRGGTPLGGRGARNRSRALQALLGFISVAETGEDLAPVQPGRDVLRTELRRFRVALVRVRESVHPGVDDPFVVPRDRVLGPDMNRLVVAVEGFREQAFLEVDRAEVAPRDLVLRV